MKDICKASYKAYRVKYHFVIKDYIKKQGRKDGQLKLVEFM